MDVLGKLVKLRALELEDMETLRGYHNNPDIAEKIGGWSFPISSLQQINWYNNLNNDMYNQRWAIEVNGEFIGISTLTNIDYKNRNAEHGLIIGNPDSQGKGYGVDTIMATMKYAFEELQLHRLDATIIESNIASLNVYTKKCGWRNEGRLKEHIFRNNRYYDRLIVGILKSEYEKKCMSSDYWEE